jgi:hypothetical protein
MLLPTLRDFCDQPALAWEFPTVKVGWVEPGETVTLYASDEALLQLAAAECCPRRIDEAARHLWLMAA